MENASKALLIAASVLIVIILIAFGMKVFNSTEDVTDQTTQVSDYMSLKNETTIIDLKFSKYAGKRTKSEVLTMLDEAYQYNRSYQKKHGSITNEHESTTGIARTILVTIDNKIAKAGGHTGTNNPNSIDPGWINGTAKTYVTQYAEDDENKKFMVSCKPVYIKGANHLYRIYIGVVE